eukprot:TRINITY_DN3937_c1_g1_i1.p1 TRINITY_DN3937_c1_g1~~TRINITY_DN3937_c1_g1_i1.p1  ORF type:complete len:100 (+),score=9.96 TRINITY_DN3937_c1_g1_i1:316-615(+)
MMGSSHHLAVSFFSVGLLFKHSSVAFCYSRPMLPFSFHQFPFFIDEFLSACTSLDILEKKFLYHSGRGLKNQTEKKGNQFFPQVFFFISFLCALFQKEI